MRTRAQAAALIKQQFLGPKFVNGKGETAADQRPKGGQHHYGRQELRELLDFIYGGPPAIDEEKIA